MVPVADVLTLPLSLTCGLRLVCLPSRSVLVLVSLFLSQCNGIHGLRHDCHGQWLATHSTVTEVNLVCSGGPELPQRTMLMLAALVLWHCSGTHGVVAVSGSHLMGLLLRSAGAWFVLIACSGILCCNCEAILVAIVRQAIGEEIIGMHVVGKHRVHQWYAWISLRRAPSW